MYNCNKLAFQLAQQSIYLRMFAWGYWAQMRAGLIIRHLGYRAGKNGEGESFVPMNVLWNNKHNYLNDIKKALVGQDFVEILS